MIQSASSSSFPFQGTHHHGQFLFNPTSMPSSPYEPLSQSSQSGFQLPRTLERPPFNEVSRFNLKAVAPEIADVPLEYSRKRLRAQSSQLASGLRALSPSHLPTALSRSQLSQTRSLTIPLRSSSVPANTLPTHILALSSSKSSSSSNAPDVLLFPVHSIALALGCASLPRIPPYNPKISQDTVTLPVVSLTLPSPSSFPTIQNYLYTHDAATLLTGLLGSSSAVPGSFASMLAAPSHAGAAIKSTLASGQKLHQLSLHLADATGRDLQILMGRAAAIVGCWRNIVALGISDPDMWDVLDLAYEVLLGAINLAAARV